MVVEYNPRQELQRKLIILAGLLVALSIGVLLGYRLAPSSTSVDVVEEAQGVHEMGGISLDQRLINAQTASEIDRKALETLRVEMAQRHGEMAELEQAVGFYRNLMAPDDVNKAVSIGAVEFTQGVLPGRFIFRIVVQQTAEKHSELRGTLTIHFDGLHAEEPVTLGLSDLQAGAVGNDIPLQFKYFQSIEGEIEVPAGLVITGVNLSVAIKKPKQLTLKHQVPWHVEH